MNKFYELGFNYLTSLVDKFFDDGEKLNDLRYGFNKLPYLFAYTIGLIGASLGFLAAFLLVDILMSLGWLICSMIGFFVSLGQKNDPGSKADSQDQAGDADPQPGDFGV